MCLLPILILGLFLYQEIQPYFTGYLASKKAGAAPFTLVTIPKSEPKLEGAINPIEISQVPFEQLEYFATNDYNYPIFEKNGVKYEILYQEMRITHLQLSPNKRKIGFSAHSSQNEVVIKEPFLVIMDIAKRNFKEISEGDLKISNWEWKGNTQFIIYINCGTGCHLAHVRSVTTGKLISEYLDKQD
ncbi:hypothetical protein KA001_00415 [Patescibacteria group bacterium]|nr:hypothetical protein [Patescibacteria group bacterium]